MRARVKPAWLLVSVIGVSAWIALTRDHVYPAPAGAELERPSALGADSLEPDDDTAPEQVVDEQAAAPAADSAGEPSGEVLESQDVANYTYLRLKTAAGEVWAAVPRATVRVHDQVQITGASLMRDFESKTLKRTFPSIYFGTLASAGASASNKAQRSGSGAALSPRAFQNTDIPGPVSGDEALPPGHPPIGSAGADPYAPGTPLPPGHPRIDSL
jgi:hypothetical protein